nr:MAG TPA: hypothetical protein [Caudoviricetes sp.]
MLLFMSRRKLCKPNVSQKNGSTMRVLNVWLT